MLILASFYDIQQAQESEEANFTNMHIYNKYQINIKENGMEVRLNCYILD